MGRGGDGAAFQYVAREVLERLADDMTVDDVRRSREDYPEGPMRGFGAIYYAAVRMGEAEAGEDAATFLARVRIKDLTAVMAAATASLPEGQGDTSSSPGSAGSGA